MTIYTADFGGYDNQYNGADVRYSEVNDPYSGCKGLSDKMRAKMYKVLNPDGHDVWIDSNIEVLDREGLEKLFEGCDLGFFRHPLRSTVLEEVQECKSVGYITQEWIDAHVDLIRTNSALLCGGIIYRGDSYSDRVDDIIERFNEEWWKLICLLSDRDQLTLPIAVEGLQNVIDIRIIELNIYNNSLFKIHSHR